MKIHNKIPLLLTLLVVVMMAAPIMSMAVETQPTVRLGTTSRFAVLAGETITNTGTTTINGSAGGDVGLFPGTEFPGQASVTMSGAVNLADDVASIAKDDLVIAYNDAAGRLPVTRIPTELGGTTLTPGTYDSADGTFQITGTLTLDAQGDSDAVFVFKTATTLVTASDSNVKLINKAQSCRTFWKVGSSATLGTNSDFTGRIFALTSIAANSGATVKGQLLARNGEVTLDNNTITNEVCVTTPTVPDEELPPVVDTPTVPDEELPPVVDTPTVPGEDAGEEHPQVADTTTVSGGELPNTATPWYNVLLAGAALTLLGAIGWRSTRKN